MMRLIYLPVLALMAGTSPAFAGTDSSDLPNPFTDQSVPKPSITSGGAAATDTGAASQNPNSPPGQNGDFGTPANDQSNAPSPGSFYQATKKGANSQ